MREMLLCHSEPLEVKLLDRPKWPLLRAYHLQRRQTRALPARWSLQSEFDLCGVKFQVRHDAAQCIAMDTELSSRLALVALIAAQDFLNVTPAKLSDSFLISDTAGVHLHDQIVQFAFHFDLTYL